MTHSIHLLSIADIARECGITTQAVEAWRRSQPSFPQPDATYGINKRPLYLTRKIAAWLHAYRPRYAVAACRMESVGQQSHTEEA